MPPRIPDLPHSLPPEEVAGQLRVRPGDGLDPAEAARRRAACGPNQLRGRKPRSLAAILLHQFRSVVVYLLAAATVLALAMGDHLEAAAILAVLALNGAIGFFTEWHAARSMEALRHLAETCTRVRRGGLAGMIAARDLVPGDVVLLEAGDMVTADLRLIRAAGLQSDESVLTGESLPVDKDPAPVAAEALLADRTCMAWKGTAVTRGSAEGIVTGTGMGTEIGRISRLVTEAGTEATPLEVRLDQLGRKLIWLMLALAAVTVAAGLLRGHPLGDIVQTGVALAVAAVPEGLPVVATLCLARGMWRMARRNAVVNHLSSVETLGATTLILTDKTGTLTENRMTVVRYLVDGGEIGIPPIGSLPSGRGGLLELAIRIGALCNGAAQGGETPGRAAGDPMELALLEIASRAGLFPGPERLAAEHAFDPARLMMARVHAVPEGGYFYAVKGAPEAVIAAASHLRGPGGLRPLDIAARTEWLERNHAMAASGLRGLALAMKTGDRPDAPPYDGLVLVALVALADPLRKDVPAAVAACRRAGIRVAMVTGDHGATALSIAREAGICGENGIVIGGRELAALVQGQPGGAAAGRIAAADVFARVSPEAKLALVSFFREAGHVVAMTGDGVNDAPALGKADIGIAMGRRGTQVAREAADVVLRDDSFATIVSAVREGRVIFDNIRKFVIYLMSCNISEVLIVGLAVGAGLPAPLLPLQILFLNLVTDVFPAFALGLGRGAPGVLARPPRPPCEPLMRPQDWRRVAVLSGSITLATLVAFALALLWLGLLPEQAVSVAFLTLALAQLWNVFNAGGIGRPTFAAPDARNPFIWGAILLCLSLLAAAFLVPGASALLRLPDPGLAGLYLASGLSSLPLIAGAAYSGTAGPAEPDGR
ncbi:cation-transporting P-type ATPase [Poseidonocella sp. HB161398]|uniref:cation-translocating P-type ATPase n=1 Tax=Poseidonocella sp. HB161398 TaxID=2320855 RepID=UPI001108A7B4|nr:cation-transporting P-type ATPase [Poseidonocella sp. HB161398]